MADLLFPKSLPDFQKLFPDDAACATYLERIHWREQFVYACGWTGEPYRFKAKPWVLRCRAGAPGLKIVVDIRGRTVHYTLTMNDTERQNTIAQIHIGTWGSTSCPPTAWEGFAHAETDYAPEWISESELNCDRDECVTVLDYSLGEPKIPDGYRIAYQFQAGEHECPECHKRQPGDREDYEGQPLQADCQLCEGDGIIYSGEECTVLVLAPRYSYGSGMCGCLFDNGPYCATSVEAAADALVESLEDALREGEADRLRYNLKTNGAHYFESPADAGAQYCEVTDMRDDRGR